MPMRWTPENDQLLLVTILETHDIAVDAKKVSQAWHAKGDQDKPTPRAISERLVRIRQIIKSFGADGVFTIATKGIPSTPSASRSRPAKPTPRTPTSGKRKRTQAPMIKNEDDGHDDNSDDVGMDTPSKKRTASTAFKPLGVANGEESPKRSRKPTTHPDMVDHASETEGDGEKQVKDAEDTSGSEFVPDDSGNVDAGNADAGDVDVAIKVEEV